MTPTQASAEQAEPRPVAPHPARGGIGRIAAQALARSSASAVAGTIVTVTQVGVVSTSRYWYALRSRRFPAATRHGARGSFESRHTVLLQLEAHDVPYRCVLVDAASHACAACSSGAAPRRRPRPRTDRDRSRPTRPRGSVGEPTAPARRHARGSLPPNHTGRIPVLEYHVIGGDKNALYTRTAASFKADLEDAYKRGYRPITIAQMLDKNFSDVPAGMSPVVFVFDDASPEQFRYIEQNGKLDDRSDERRRHLARFHEDASRLEQQRRRSAC